MQRLTQIHDQLAPNQVVRDAPWAKYRDSGARHDKYRDIIEKYSKEVQIVAHPSFATKAIHVGSEPDPIWGMVTPAISVSTTFAQRSPGVPYSKFDYSRVGNPTREAFERCLASLEFGRYCIATGSGCGAMTAIMLLLSTGDHVIISNFLNILTLFACIGHLLR